MQSINIFDVFVGIFLIGFLLALGRLVRDSFKKKRVFEGILYLMLIILAIVVIIVLLF